MKRFAWKRQGVVAVALGLLFLLFFGHALFVLWLWSIPAGPLGAERRFYPWTSIEVLFIDLPVQRMLGGLFGLSLVFLLLLFGTIGWPLKKSRRH